LHIDGFIRQVPLAEEAGVQLALDNDGCLRVVTEHDNPIVLRRPRREQCKPARILLQVEGILDRVEAEGVLREVTLGQSCHERVRENLRIDGGDGVPALGRV